MQSIPDRRLNAYRADLADARLRGIVQAERYVEAKPATVTAAPATPLRPRPSADEAYDSEALFGERLRLFDTTADGWAWVQAERDGYVGYCRASDISKADFSQPTHFVSAARTQRYRGPSLKRPPLDILTIGAELRVLEVDGKYARLADETYIFARHIRPAETFEKDPTSTALKMIETPYVWGGKTALGLDCSALVQLAFQACGIPCPRDTDMQSAMDWQQILCQPDGEPLHRNDLVFWPGHVGMMIDQSRIVHANASDMSTRVWDLAHLRDHISRIEGNAVSRILRPPPPSKEA